MTREAPGPLTAVFVFLAAGLCLAVVALLLLGCSSTRLPPEKCTPLNQRAALDACERALKLECELRPEIACPDTAICKDALAEVCP